MKQLKLLAKYNLDGKVSHDKMWHNLVLYLQATLKPIISALKAVDDKLCFENVFKTQGHFWQC